MAVVVNFQVVRGERQTNRNHSRQLFLPRKVDFSTTVMLFYWSNVTYSIDDIKISSRNGFDFPPMKEHVFFCEPSNV